MATSTNQTEAAARLASATNTLIATIDAKFSAHETSTAADITAAINTQIDALKGGVAEEGDTLNKLYNLIQGLNTQITNLNNTYATDSELAAKFTEVSEAWAAADADIQALIDTLATKDEMNTKITEAKDAAMAHTDAGTISALDALSQALEDGNTTLQV